MLRSYYHSTWVGGVGAYQISHYVRPRTTQQEFVALRLDLPRQESWNDLTPEAHTVLPRTRQTLFELGGQ